MEGLDILNDSIDKKLVPPLHQKRILAFVNHFLISSCTFLNEFITKCEERFIDIERKMQKLEASLIILEAKLSLIPDVEIATVGTSGEETIRSQQVENMTIAKPSSQSSCDKISEPPEDQTEVIANNPPEAESNTDTKSALESNSGIKACEDMRYKKFFKMVQFGVPPNAVKIKMTSEGVDPNILDSPNLILPNDIQS